MTDLAALKDRVADGADAEGLIDVAYAHAESPIGDLLLAATPRGLVTVGFPSHDEGDILAGLAERISPRLIERPRLLDRARRELDEYFSGDRRSFALDLDWVMTRGFRRRVLIETARIPFGETRTYSHLAASAGSPRAHRAAGSALGSNPLPIVVPCHRVLRSGGGLGGYAGGLDVKRRLLEIEGVVA